MRRAMDGWPASSMACSTATTSTSPARCFDYGPWRFRADPRTPRFTAAYFDHAGLYSFGRQPEALQWNVFQLAGALRLVTGVAVLTPALQAFGERYTAAFVAAMLRRLGVRPLGDGRDAALVQAMTAGLEAAAVPLDDFWFDWRGGRLRRPAPQYDAPAFAAYAGLVADHASDTGLGHSYWSDAAPCTLLIDEIEAIWAAIADADDWRPFDAKVAAIRRMGEAMAA